MTARVFVPEEIRRHLDLSHAETFGTLQPLLDHIDPFNISVTMARLTSALCTAEFDPEKDYLCLVGRTLSVSLALLAAVDEFECIRVLMFDARHSEYRVRVIGESNAEHEDEEPV